MNDKMTTEKLARIMGCRIKDAREKDDRNWSQEELGRRLGLSKQTIGNYEQGRRDIGHFHLLELSRIFKVPISYFYPEGDGDENDAQLSLSYKLASLRKLQDGLTMQKLAALLGVSREKVSSWEAGTEIPTLRELKALADYYKIGISYLLNQEVAVEYDADLLDRLNTNRELKEILNQLLNLDSRELRLIQGMLELIRMKDAL